ncbi:hypothetical protein B0H19DRAFT_1060126 [Mycena capillaripes]|nr:hypothetical protein B0H19DRAFT_1060126 [Mycena capillaripes]
MPVVDQVVPSLEPSLIETRIRKILSSAGLDPDLCLNMLRKTRSLISGSSALSVLFDNSFSPNDLDIYTCADTEAAALAFLQQDMFFTIDRSSNLDNHYSTDAGLFRIHWLRKGLHLVNLMVVRGEDAAAAVFYFHSSLVMNFFNWEVLYCAYPALTLAKRGIPNWSIITDSRSRERAYPCFKKYTDRGFTFVPTSHDGRCGEDKCCPTTIRALHDDGGLVIPFPSRHNMSVTTLTPVGDSKMSVIWALGGSICSSGPLYVEHFVASVPVARQGFVSYTYKIY